MGSCRENCTEALFGVCCNLSMHLNTLEPVDSFWIFEYGMLCLRSNGEMICETSIFKGKKKQYPTCIFYAIKYLYIFLVHALCNVLLLS